MKIPLQQMNWQTCPEVSSTWPLPFWEPRHIKHWVLSNRLVQCTQVMEVLSHVEETANSTCFHSLDFLISMINCIIPVSITLNWFETGAQNGSGRAEETSGSRTCLSIHRLWTKRPLQLCSDAIASKKFSRTSACPTSWRLLTFHNATLGPANPQGYWGHSWCGKLTQSNFKLQVMILCTVNWEIVYFSDLKSP